MDSPKLRELTRAQLQSLAKREVIRAVGKSEDIIRRLLRKHPKGVPVTENGENPSASSAPPRRSPPKKSRKDARPRSPAPAPTPGRIDRKGKEKAVAKTLSPSSSSEALQQLLYPEDEPMARPSDTYPRNAAASRPQRSQSEALPGGCPTAEPVSLSRNPTLAVPRPERAPNGRASYKTRGGTRSAASTREAPHANPPPERHAAEEGRDDGVEGDDDDTQYARGGPNHYMVVDALRQITTLTNAIPTMEASIAERRQLLKQGEAQLEQATPSLRRLVVTREYLERFYLGRMKHKPELWDGTAMMGKKDRKARMQWLRSLRKEESTKRWEEANEENRKYGLAPEPYSAFVSQSDEETTESLQTTPAGSRSGSPKRAREESIDRQVDTDGQRKRARQ